MPVLAVAAGGAPDLLVQALVYLGAAVLMVPIAQRLGLGSVLGYLAAGILVGPHVIGLVGDTTEVQHFAEFGVVMMLFLIGLELQPRVLWRLRGSVLGLGGLQVLVSTLVIGGASVALGVPWNGALALGLILALSSTAIVMQTLHERALEKTQPGRLAFSVLLFQDIAVIPILAMLPLLAPKGAGGEATASAISHLPGYFQAPIIIAAVAAVVVVGRVLARPLFRRVAATHQRELFTGAALLLVVGISVLMAYVGLSAALGTFIAGVVLADSEYRHELESDLEPFKGLLLGLFFITVGAGIDFGLIVDQPLVVAGLTVLLMVLKGVVLRILGAIWRLQDAYRWTFTSILAQGGEFAFVLLTAAVALGVLESSLAQLVVVVVALTMALTPLMLIVNERLLQPRLAKPDSEREADDPSHHRAPVVVAGFGRFGQSVGRLLKANGIDSTVLDMDPDTVGVLRNHGMEVFFGDATRQDLLEKAGCDEAKLFVCTVDDPDHALRIVETVRRHYPNLPIVSRAKDTRHAHMLHGEGVQKAVCEVTGGGLALGQAALQAYGFRAYQAQRAMRRFRKHEEETQKLLFDAWGDASQTLQVAKARTADLERLLDADDADRRLREDSGWEATDAVEAAHD